jgi:proliferating cell nuclear antigen
MSMDIQMMPTSYGSADNTTVPSTTEFNNVFTARTVQSSIIRHTMNALQHVLVETNIVITPDGIRILNMDKSHTILVHVWLDKNNFEFFECKRNKVVLGVNVMTLNTIINTLEADEILTMYVENRHYNEHGMVSYLCIQFERSQPARIRTYDLRLIDADTEELPYPQINYTTIWTMPSTEFHKNIRDAMKISNRIEICSVGDDLFYKYNGKFISANIHIKSEKEGVDADASHVKKASLQVMQGIFALKNLNHCTRFTSLSPQYMELYMANNMPLVVKYNISNLGHVTLAIAQATKTTIK